MYRAIPEVNRICAMADRSRRYRLHQEALSKIRSKSQNNQSPNKQKQIRPYSLHGKAQKEEQERINYENKKIINAIINQDPTIKRADLIELEMDHNQQVSRKRNSGAYGHENPPQKHHFKADKDELPSLSS